MIIGNNIDIDKILYSNAKKETLENRIFGWLCHRSVLKGMLNVWKYGCMNPDHIIIQGIYICWNVTIYIINLYNLYICVDISITFLKLSYNYTLK